METTVKRYTTPAEDAAEIRKAYKARGWNSRDVSVRAEQFSMGSSINVTIKDPRVDWREAERIAEGKERIARCEITGEILSGGNRYVHVRHSEECKRAMGAVYAGPMREAFEEAAKRDDGTLMPLPKHVPNGERVWIGKRDQWTGTVWIGDSFAFQFYPDDGGIMGAAAELAKRLSFDRAA